MMNVGNPETAFAFGQLPNEGIGLARLEFAGTLSVTHGAGTPLDQVLAGDYRNGVRWFFMGVLGAGLGPSTVGRSACEGQRIGLRSGIYSSKMSKMSKGSTRVHG